MIIKCMLYKCKNQTNLYRMKWFNVTLQFPTILEKSTNTRIVETIMLYESKFKNRSNMNCKEKQSIF